MPELGKYEKLPRPESISQFLKYIVGNPFVKEVIKLDDQLFLISRKDKSDLRIYLTNVYIVGFADVMEILGIESDIQAIVTMSAWNSYTYEAKEYCRDNKIGLFKFKEFLGALYHDGRKFINYTPPK